MEYVSWEAGVSGARSSKWLTLNACAECEDEKFDLGEERWRYWFEQVLPGSEEESLLWFMC